MSVVLADSQPLGQQQRVLKHRNTFGVFDERGDVVSRGLGEQGLYHLDTRHLSRFAFRLGGKHPLVLSSAVTHGNFLLALDMTNPDIGAGPEMSKNSLHVFRGRFLRDGALYEELRFTNYGDEPISLPCRLEFESDFRDLFEVRGSRRPERLENQDRKVANE